MHDIGQILPDGAVPCMHLGIGPGVKSYLSSPSVGFPRMQLHKGPSGMRNGCYLVQLLQWVMRWLVQVNHKSQQHLVFFSVKLKQLTAHKITLLLWRLRSRDHLPHETYTVALFSLPRLFFLTLSCTVHLLTKCFSLPFFCFRFLGMFYWSCIGLWSGWCGRIQMRWPYSTLNLLWRSWMMSWGGSSSLSRNLRKRLWYFLESAPGLT